jgi:hypothetical protein
MLRWVTAEQAVHRASAEIAPVRLIEVTDPGQRDDSPDA